MIGPPVKVLFVQNTNPASVAPDQTKVKQGLAREDLFTCVHEQFMTETAKFADIVLPATTTLERDDIGSASRDRFMIDRDGIVRWEYIECADEGMAGDSGRRGGGSRSVHGAPQQRQQHDEAETAGHGVLPVD